MHATAHILEESCVRDAAVPITVAQYHRLSAAGIVSERTELLQGVMIEQMTKSSLDTFLVQRLAAWLSAGMSNGMFVRKEEPLTLTDSEPEPDIAVVAGSPEDYREAHPATAELVIEVAIATLGVDRAKADVYAAAGITEYWIVVPEARNVLVYRDPSPAGYRSHEEVTHADAELAPRIGEVTPLTLQQLFS
jgi:Uma2 family endonuclease